MSQNSGVNAPPLPASASSDSGKAFETSVRQLIANGRSRTALENAKQFHKAQRTTASESLLLDAYMARIQSLLDQNLAPEAKSLLDLVRERFPSAKDRIEGLMAAASARGGDLAGLLQPLNDPELTSERRTAIEQTIQTQMVDLTALAGCAALPPEHSLRQAAAALDRAFNVVTSGPVTDEQIALPEVSYRSPLAPWKVLIRAIACFHRGEDEACREYLTAIKLESVPSRLVPAIRAILGEKPATALKPAAAALVSGTAVNLSELHRALTDLDRAFAEEHNQSHIFKAVRTAVRECQRSAPDRVGQLKQLVFVRGGVACLDMERLTAALEGGVPQDAVFFRMYARTLESSGHPEDLPAACGMWNEFREQAVREGWFRANSVEAATLYLHMAEGLRGLPDESLSEVQGSTRAGRKQVEEDYYYYLYPEKLYARACVLDPHSEAFSQWMRWAAGRSVPEAERVCREWHRILPDDLEPLLYLMEQSEKRNAFPTALSYLEKAERIDAVHSEVRAARLRLLAAAAIRHLQQNKPHLAEEKLVAIAALPQSRQGDRPAFLAALRHLIAVGSGDKEGAAAALNEVETVLGGSLAAGFLVFGIASISKRLDSAHLPRVEALSRQERTAIPRSLARVMMLTKDLGMTKIGLPDSYFAETEAQFPGVSDTLDVQQIRMLGELGMATEHPKLAWAASGAGLQRSAPGEAGEAHFLLLRARAIPSGYGPRYLALAAAAAEFGRFHREMDVVNQAVRIVRNPLGGESISLTLDQAREVVRKELASPGFPSPSSPGPDYTDLLPEELCQCPNCRRQRGESPGLFDDEGILDDDEFDEAQMRKAFDAKVPEDMPPDIAGMLFEVMKEGFLSGESPDEIMTRILGKRGGKQKKGRKKR